MGSCRCHISGTAMKLFILLTFSLGFGTAPLESALPSDPIEAVLSKPNKKFLRQWYGSRWNAGGSWGQRPRLIGYNPQPGSVLIRARTPTPPYNFPRNGPGSQNEFLG